MCLLYSSSCSLRSLSNELRTNSTTALNNHDDENHERERIEQHHDHNEYAGVSKEEEQQKKVVDLSTTVLATAKIKRLITGILFQANDILYSPNHKYTNNNNENNNSNDDDRQQQQSNNKHEHSTTTPIWFKAVAVFIATIFYHSDQAIQSIDRILGLVRDLVIHNFICLVTVLATRYCSRNLCHTIKDYMNMPIAEEDKSSESIGNSSKIKEEERILEQMNNDEEDDCRDEVEMEESSSSPPSSSISQEIREAVQESIQESSVEQQQQPSQQVKSSSFLPGGNFEDETDEWGHFTDFQDTEEMPMTVLSTSTSTSSLSTCCSLDDSTTTLNSTTTSSFNTASTMTTSPFMGEAATPSSSSSMSSNCNHVNGGIGIDGSNNYFSLDDPFKSINRAILRMRGDVSVCKMDKLTEEEQDDIDDE
jgi:hypothetical protein